MEEKKELLLFQLGPVQEFIAQAAEVSDLWAGSYLLSSLILAGERAVPGWDDEKKVNPNFVFPNFTDSTVIDAMEGPAKIPTIPNRFLVWVSEGEGRKIANDVKKAIGDKLREFAKDLPVGAEEQVEQFAQMSFAVLSVPCDTEKMGEYYRRLGEILAARRAVREFESWRETVETGPKDFLSGTETALKDGLGAMNLIKRKIYGQQRQKTNPVPRFRGKADTYIAVIAMDGDRMGLNLSKFAKAEEHRDFSGALARFATAVEGVVRKHGGALIYAGGDDVLAVTEAKQAIECAKELRRKFGEVKGFDGNPLTASAGIAVGHEKVPLQDLIHAAHSAESRAKNDYGRNALALDVYKRSGEILNWGCNWGANCDSKALEVLEKLSESRGGLPARFPYKLAELLMPYGKIDSSLKGVVELEFDHAWERSAGAEVPAAIKSAADAYLDECCKQKRINDFLALFLCDTFIAREREKKGLENK